MKQLTKEERRAIMIRVCAALPHGECLLPPKR